MGGVLRDEDYLRAEIRWLVERARVALDLSPSAVVGCTDEQIAEILEAQEITEMPAPLDELMRVAGVEAGLGGADTLISALLGWTGIGYQTMLDAKEHARQTAAYTGSEETFDPDRVVFLSDPGGTVLWLETDEADSPVWALTEGSARIGLAHARLACFFEDEVVKAEVGWPDREYWSRRRA
jgi:hypothetical protein